MVNLVRLLAPILFLASLFPRAGLAAQSPRFNDSLLVTPAWLAERLADPRLVVLQVGRDSGGYLAGHIPGSRFVALNSIVTERDGLPNEIPDVVELDRVLETAGVSNESRLVLYGDPLSAGRMFFTLDYLGMGGRVALLDGGFSAWRTQGRPVSQDVTPVVRGSFEPRIQPEVLVNRAWVEARLGDSGVALIDARPLNEWSGEVAGEGVPRAGQIPGARTFYWRLALASPEPPMLKDGAILAKLLGRAGARPGRTVVTYCRTGVQASYLYFVARYLGYSPKMYDGSFIEWSRRPEVPVAP